MSFIPDETAWIDYLYGELDPETHQRMTQYLQDNPAAKQELAQFASLRQRLKYLDDKTPLPLAKPVVRQTNLPLPKGIPKPIQYAATLVIALVCLMVAAKATELHLRWGQTGLYIGFGNPEFSPTPQAAATVSDSSENLLRTPEKFPVDSLFRHLENTLDRELARRFQVAEEELIGKIGSGMERRMDASFQAAQQEQALHLASYWEGVALAQKQYTEALLEDFSQTLQQLREEDLVFLLDRLNGIQYENEQLQQEISDLLHYLLAETDTSKPKQP
ncbi:anti-sigma factor family protein [Lunatimonas salinarum]|uniref:anti-sigma factor family protein n=1 Tax=Lunatimonas salinarum TaxID=1774590 RepID=UPI001AE097AC|nr:hypothetical protein [Lunatimonas salinarum]